MRKNDPAFLSVPQRQSPVAVFLILFKFISLLARQAWPLLLVFFFRQSGDSENSWFTLFFIAAAALSSVLSVISYFKFYFYVKDEELVIEKGVIQKTKLNVPFDRIQTINFNENLIHRFFNVVSLEIDTAGSSGKEFAITALDKAKAITIREWLLARKNETQSDNLDQALEEDVAAIPDELLLNLSIGDLVKVGVGQNHVRSAGILLAFVFGSMEYVESAMGKKAFKKLETEYIEVLINSVISIVLFVLIAAFFITLVSTVIRYFDLKFLKTANGFKVISGLFTRKENSANMQKIQLIQWGTNPIKKIFNLMDLRLLQAASSAVGRKQAIYVPGCYEPQLTEVRQAYFPNETQQSFTQHGIHWRIIIRRLVSYFLLPAIAFLLIDMASTESIIISLVWFLLILITSIIYQRRWAFYVSEEGIRTTQGIIGSSDLLLKWYKVQSVKIKQSIFQKRRGLADIIFYTAGGAVSIPYIEIEKATQLKDYVLYKVEVSKEKWM